MKRYSSASISFSKTELDLIYYQGSESCAARFQEHAKKRQLRAPAFSPSESPLAVEIVLYFREVGDCLSANFKDAVGTDIYPHKRLFQVPVHMVNQAGQQDMKRGSRSSRL